MTTCNLIDNLCSSDRRWWKMKTMTFWKVKLGSHQAPLTRISEVLQVVWAPRQCWTCQTICLWWQGFVIETNIPPHPALQYQGAHCLSFASNKSKDLTQATYFHGRLNSTVWTDACLFLFAPLQTKGKDWISCAIFYNRVDDKCWRLSFNVYIIYVLQLFDVNCEISNIGNSLF